MKRTLYIALLALTGTGCASSVETIVSQPAIEGGACNVTVYQTRAQATARGEIDELCIISGSSSGSFRHTISTAIDKQKDRVCACGATNAFVESRSDSGLSVATVTLIAFKYRNPQN